MGGIKVFCKVPIEIGIYLWSLTQFTSHQRKHMGVKSHYDAISKAYLPLGDSVTTFAHREFCLWAITLMQK